MIALLLLALLAAGPDGSELQALVAPLTAARTDGRLGQVAGSAGLEPQTGQGPPIPIAGVSLVVLPRSPALLRDLEDVKAKARESEAAYFGAVAAVAGVRERYEQALREVGAGDLIFSGTSDARGDYLFARVPAGEWLLIARSESVRRLPARGPSRRERERFVLRPKSLGYRDVTYWVTPVTVVAGDTVRIVLSDRNPWLRGVAEERKAPEGR